MPPPLWRLPRHCLENLGCGGFSRWCLENLLLGPRQIECTHVGEVCPAKAAAETTTGQVIGKLRDLRMTVRGPRLAALLALCDAPPNLSVGCRHHGIDVARGLNTATTSS